MEPVAEKKSQIWSPGQAYALSGICLILGMLAGYIAHPKPVASAATTFAAPTAASAPTNTMQQPSPEQLKAMADKKVEPLLAELKNKPNDPALLAQVGDAYFWTHNFSLAKDYYERSVKAKPQSDVLTRLSSCYYFSNDPDKAIALLQQALQLDPKNSLALFNLGMLEWHVKTDPKAAISAWEKFQQVSPNDPKHAQVEQLIAKAKKHVAIAPGTMTDKPAM